jgi:predicted nucleic acid-binding protein
LKYLIDTDVLSEHSKAERCNPHVRSWYARIDTDELGVSALIIGELRRGVEGLRQRDTARAVRLERWLILMIDLFANRIIGIDRRVAERWGWLTAATLVPAVDGLIAATAIEHAMTVVTRNVRDFEATGVRILNPFEPPT